MIDVYKKANVCVILLIYLLNHQNSKKTNPKINLFLNTTPKWLLDIY